VRLAKRAQQHSGSSESIEESKSEARLREFNKGDQDDADAQVL
jgi:hypothetical protein